MVLQPVPVSCHFGDCKAPLSIVVSVAMSSELPLPFYYAGVKKGDRVAVYMPMIIEMVVTLLACARLGIIHSVVVSEFLPVFLGCRQPSHRLHSTKCSKYDGICRIETWINAFSALTLVMGNRKSIQNVENPASKIPKVLIWMHLGYWPILK